MPAEEGASLDLSLLMLIAFFTTLLQVLHCVLTKVPTGAKTTSCRFYSCSFGHADNARATGSSLVATKEKLSLQSRIHIILEEEEDKEEESPSFGRCRPLCRVADSGPKPKVNYPYISALPSLMIYPRMCGHVLEPDSRLGLSVPAGTLPVSGLPRRLRYFLGPRLPLQPPKELWQGSSTSREQPHPGLAEDLEQPTELHKRPSSP